MRSIKLPSAAIFFFFVLTLAASNVVFAGWAGVESPTVSEAESSLSSEAPLAPFQEELLELAFETATKIPINPHIKDRSRAQEAVVAVCLELDRPELAARYIEKIENWRQGLSYADLAFYLARNGDKDEAKEFLAKAQVLSETAEDWRRDRILARIAQTQMLLGQAKTVESFQTSAPPSESGKVELVKAMLGEKDSFEEQMKGLDSVLALQDFDATKNALSALAELYDRFYKDSERRELVEKKIKGSGTLLPTFFRFELVTQLAETALDHSDLAKSPEFIDEAQSYLAGYDWPLEHRLPMIAKLAELRFKAGDEENARKTADEALAIFEEQGHTVVNIYRAGALRPLAGAYQVMGASQTAAAVYEKAIEEGMENPNSRPHAEDLSATCSSMAFYQFEPDAELWARIREIYESLRDPW